MKWYKLIFKQNQPIHIGSTKWGVVNKTEIFIPGWTMWGALTKAYNIFKQVPLSANQNLFETITCFYPYIKDCNNPHAEFNPLLPKYKDGAFHLDDYLEDEFKFKFVDTFVSTAILPESRQAKDESLHELELLLPKSKDGNNEIYWIGLVALENKNIINDFLKVGLKIFIGADAKYGFGELELMYLVEEKNILDNILNRFQLREDGTFSYNNENFASFLEFSNDLIFEGELVLLAEFNFLQNSPQVKETSYFIIPGSKLLQNSNNLNNYKLKKGKFIKSGG
jgi:hypothetical protein